MADWNWLLDRVAATQKGAKLRPQTVVRALSDLAPTNAVYNMDAGANTHFAARMIQIREGQRWSGTGTLVSMASALPYSVAAACAFPDRMSIAVAGDGGLAMLMAELSTAVHRKLDVKVLVRNNDAFGEVVFEQRELGYPNYGVDLGHIDYARFAEGCRRHLIQRHQPFRAETRDGAVARDTRLGPARRSSGSRGRGHDA